MPCPYQLLTERKNHLMNILLNIIGAWTALSIACYGLVYFFNLEEKVAQLEAQLRNQPSTHKGS